MCQKTWLIDLFGDPPQLLVQTCSLNLGIIKHLGSFYPDPDLLHWKEFQMEHWSGFVNNSKPLYHYRNRVRTNQLLITIITNYVYYFKTLSLKREYWKASQNTKPNRDGKVHFVLKLKLTKRAKKFIFY